MNVSRTSTVSFDDSVFILPLRPSGSNQDLPMIDLSENSKRASPESKTCDVARQSFSSNNSVPSSDSINPILGSSEMGMTSSSVPIATSPPSPTNSRNRLSEENLLNPAPSRLTSIELESPVLASPPMDRDQTSTQTHTRYDNDWVNTCFSTSSAACERLGNCIRSFVRQDQWNARDE